MSKCRLAVLVSVVLVVASPGLVRAQFLPEIGTTSAILARGGTGVAITNEHATGMKNPAALPMLFRMPTERPAESVRGPEKTTAELDPAPGYQATGGVLFASARGVDGKLLALSGLHLRSGIDLSRSVARNGLGRLQVQIETRFISIDQNFLREVGVDYRGLGVGVAGYSQDTTSDQDTRSFQAAIGKIGNPAAFAGGWIEDFDNDFFYVAGGAVVSHPRIIGDNPAALSVGVKVSRNDLHWQPNKTTLDVGLVLRALERVNVANTLVTPSIALVGRDLTDRYGVFPDAGRRFDFGVGLTGEKWRFAADVDDILNDREYGGRKVKTSIEIKSGRTIIIGGLTSDGEATVGVRQQVPLPGKIPLLGALFARGDDHDERAELMVVVTPTIVTDE